MAEICSVNVRYKTVICFLFIHSRIHSVSKSERTDKQIISNLRLPKVWSCTWWESNLGVCLWFAIAFLKKMAEARKIAWIIWTIKLIWNIMKLDLVLFDLVLFILPAIWLYYKKRITLNTALANTTESVDALPHNLWKRHFLFVILWNNYLNEENEENVRKNLRKIY